MSEELIPKSEEMTKPSVKKEVKRYLTVVICAFVFSLCVNTVVVPMGLYNGGVLGIAQILRTIVERAAGGSVAGGTDIAGIINFAINVPLFVIAFRTISKNFFAKTLLFVVSQTVFMTFLKAPAEPIVDDMLTNCIIGGLIGGVSLGLTLRSSGCSGGLDVVGVYLLKKFDGFSVGRVSLVINIITYCVCAYMFNIQTAIYSIIYSAVQMLAVDRTHSQNINVTCIIISKEKEVREMIMERLSRGVTCWKGFGAYTGTDTDIMVTVVNKYEEPVVKQIVKEQDPGAFVIFFEGTHVGGHFVKRI